MAVDRLPSWAKLFLVATAAVVVLAIGFLVSRGSQYDPAPTAVHQFDVIDEDTVVLHWTTGGCSGGVDHVDQAVAPEAIVITLWHRSQTSGDCEDWGAEATHEIELDEPLRGRQLLDGFCVDPRPTALCPDGVGASERPTRGP